MTDCVLLVAGDPSGDLHGSRLAQALRRLRPGLKVAAVGGPCLQFYGAPLAVRGSDFCGSLSVSKWELVAR